MTTAHLIAGFSLVLLNSLMVSLWLNMTILEIYNLKNNDYLHGKSNLSITK